MNNSPVSAAGDPAALRWFGWLVAIIAIAAFLGLTVTTLLGASARYLGVRGVEWSFEISGILFLWTTFFGVILAELRKENVAFTLFVDRLSRPAGRVVAILCGLATLWLAYHFLMSGLAFAARSGSSPTPLLRLPRLVQILPLVCFAGGTILIVAVRLIQDLMKGRSA